MNDTPARQATNPDGPAGDGTDTARWRDIAQQVLDIEAQAIQGLKAQIDDSFDEAIRRMREVTGRIVCTGIGKSGHVMKKVAATLASTGSPSLFLHPAEAIHGDLGMIAQGDLVLAASFSGRSDEFTVMMPLLRERGIPVVAITGNPNSPLAAAADVHLSAAIDKEACPLNLAPTASTTATLALGDALAMALLDARGFTSEDFAQFHPGGNLGRRLRAVEAVMHQGDEVPLVPGDTLLRDAIYTMSSKGFGILGVTDGGRLTGVLSDGDLRRMIADPDVDTDGLFAQPVAATMKGTPKMIERRARVQDALALMEQHRITALFVTETAESEAPVVGIVHLHDLWGSRR